MNVTNKNFFFPIEPLTSIVNPENNAIFEYLSQYLTYTKIEKICLKERIEDLIKKEKIIQDMITNNCQYKMSKLSSWTNYINWVVQLIPEIYKEQLRLFLVLETFTKSMLSESIFYSNKDYISYWIYYIDMCRDDLEILQYLFKNQICAKNYFLYESMAIIFEKFHDFRQANKCYLDGLDNKVDNIIELQKKYTKFEIRMENRINRELSQSCLSNDVIQKRLNDDIRVLNEPKFNGNKKRALPSNNFITLSFAIQENQIHFVNLKSKQDIDKQNPTVNYGDIPVFVDEPFRDSLITKGTQIVEIYILLVNFLLEKDMKFKEYNENFKKGLKAEYEKRPYSWISPKRTSTGVQSFVNTSINDSKEENTNKQKDNKQLNVDNIIAKIEDEITQSNIKEKQKREGVAKVINKQNSITTDSHLNYSIPVLQGKKETIIMRKKTKENESLIDVRIAYYKQAIEELEKKKKEEQIVQKNNFKLDSDGDICMSSDNEIENEKKETKFTKGLEKPKVIKQPAKGPELIKQQIPNLKSKINVNNNIIQNKKQISSPKNMNLFKDITDLEAIQKEEIQKKNNSKISSINSNNNNNNANLNLSMNNTNQFCSPMTIEDINDKINEVNKNYQKGQISQENRDKYFGLLEEKIAQIEKNTSNKQKQESNPLELYLNPQPSKTTNMIPLAKPMTIQNDNINYNNINNYQQNQQREALKIPKQPNFDNIKPIDPKEVQAKYNNRNNNNSKYNHSQLNNLNQFLLTPDKKDFSLSFDSNHSHLFKENKMPFEDNNINNSNNNMMSFSNILNNEINSEENKTKKNAINDINKFFTEEDDASSYIPNNNNNKVSASRLALLFINDDSLCDNNNNDNNNIQFSNQCNNLNRMSSITEKTIENTRNSSVNSMSLEKLFKS